MGGHIKLLFIFIFIKCVFSEEALMKSCNHTDVECLREMTKFFCNNTIASVQEYCKITMDPLEIKTMEYTDPESDIVMQFHDINIVGLKNKYLNAFKLNTDTKNVEFQMALHVDIAANVNIKYADAPESLTGTYMAKASSIQMVKYNYNLNTGSDGVEHFIIGLDTIECETVGVPDVTLDIPYSNTVAKDPDVAIRRDHYQKRAMEIKQKPVCTIISQAFKLVMAHVRTIMQALPATAFFKDI